MNAYQAIVILSLLGQQLAVVNQPIGIPDFVSVAPDTVTYFQTADEFDSIGLLAHNYLAGKLFGQLSLGDTITYNEQLYQVVEINRYRVLSRSTQGDLINLQTGQQQSVIDVFMANYGVANRLVLQTCIQRHNNKMWGKLFVIAIPIEANE